MTVTNTSETNVSKRLATYLPDGVFDKLEEWAEKERRSISNLAAFLLEQSVREREKLEARKEDEERDRDE